MGQPVPGLLGQLVILGQDPLLEVDRVRAWLRRLLWLEQHFVWVGVRMRVPRIVAVVVIVPVRV